MSNNDDEQFYKVLQDRFGHNQFRERQLESIRHVSAGNAALIVMPTGAGKSLCYQLPALIRGGLTVVVSPLLVSIGEHWMLLDLCFKVYLLFICVC